jgi:hypothetical protein
MFVVTLPEMLKEYCRKENERIIQARKINAPLDNKSVRQLKAGDSVLINGYYETEPPKYRKQ